MLLGGSLNTFLLIFITKSLEIPLSVGFLTYLNSNKLFYIVLAQPAHPIEMEYFEDEGIDLDREEFVIHCPLEAWHVFGFLDDTAV